MSKKPVNKVEFLEIAGGELVDRIRAEKANPQADIIYGSLSSVFIELKNEGILQPYTASWDADIAEVFKDSEGYWYGTIQTPVVLFYNHNRMDAADAPQDWFDLIKPEYKDELIF